MSLAGHTIFISGASRGIGKAIGLRAAREGANIVVAAKTAEPHPKLPGTIYSAAEEIEAAGGKALPCIVDIRSEEAVRNAVDEARKEFGKIDILINNASAISLTPSLTTGMKTYDLMNQINARGTYLCSHVMMPDLIESAAAGRQAHILNLSPPLSMKEVWFKNHTAYTMAKYGMSMCTLGMAGEFRDHGVGVNSLWPQTGVWTAAMKMLGGGSDEASAGCRTPEIMSDAAYEILTSDPKKLTGRFLIDSDFLTETTGVTDFSKYDCVPGAPLMPDFFIDDYEEKYGNISSNGLNLSNLTSEKASIDGKTPMGAIMNKLNTLLQTEGKKYVDQLNSVYLFEMKDTKERYHLSLKEGNGSCGKIDGEIEANVKFTCKEKVFVKMFNGKQNPTSAFMMGNLKIDGDLKGAMALERIMKKMNA